MKDAWAVVVSGMALVASDSRTASRLESVLAKHAQAVSGSSNLDAALTVFRGTFTAEVRTRRRLGPGSVELVVGPPDRWAVSWASPGPGGVTGEASARDSGWSDTWNGRHRWTRVQLGQKPIDIGPWLGTPLETAYSGFKWIGEELSREGRVVAILEATPAGGGLPEKLFLEEVSGLLLRRDATRTVWILDDLFEEVAFSYRYEDYKDVSGSKRPFKVRLEAPLIGFEVAFTEWARVDAVDESRFEPPR